MEIVVTHLTRMRAPRICVAGIDPDTAVDVRPVLQYRALDVMQLRSRGGPFGLGCPAELGDVVPRPSPPETEDVVFELDQARALEPMSADDFWSLLEDSAQHSLGEIFGQTLEADGRTASMAPGNGNRSLGHLRPAVRPTLDVSFGKPKLRLQDPDLGQLSISITDLRLFDPDTGDLVNRYFELLGDRLRRCDALLAVGLSRPWAREEGGPERHWLQVNNIHLDDDPLWLI